MKTLYFDCFSGISGDMTIGALLDIGVPFDYLSDNLKKLEIDGEYKLEVKKTNKCGIEGTDFYVHLMEHHHNHSEGDDHHHHDHHGRNLFDIEGMIDSSSLNDNVKNMSKEIFMVVAEAEAKVHGKGIYDVHFHEVGAVDSIVDIVGTAICIDYIKPDLIVASPINTGSGFVKCAHGILPVPAPATLNILKNIPIYSDERKFELTTPTGAAIIKALVSEFKESPNMKPCKIGYGCGKKDSEKPNLLRVILSEEEDEDNCILEATIDDMNPQIYGYLMDRLFEAGARDVYYTPIYMKKNRPGILITITAPVKIENKIKEVMFRETTTIGIRKFKIDRTVLDRRFEKVNTKYGDINFKVSSYMGEIINVTPEYEDVKAASEESKIPMKEMYRIINENSLNLLNKGNKLS